MNYSYHPDYRELLHTCKRHISQIPEAVITNYMTLDKFEVATNKFFDIPDQDLETLFETKYPFHIKAFFVEDNFRLIREIIPEFIVSIITLGTDWLITLVQTKQYRKSEVVEPAPDKDILSDTSALLLTIINHVNRLIVDKEENEKLIKETNKLLNLYQPNDFHYDIRGCFQLIFNVITLYADQCDGVRTNTLKGFKIFPKGDDDKVDILKGLVGPFCGPYHLLQIEPASSSQNPEFRKLFHERIVGNELVLTAYNPVQRIKSRYPKPKSIWQKKLTEAIHEYLDNYDWSNYLSDPDSLIDGLLKIAQVDRVSEPIEAEETNSEHFSHRPANFLDKIKFIPRANISEVLYGKKHNNKIIITRNGQEKEYIFPDEQFIYIYLLAIERRHFPDTKSLWRNENISQQYKDELKTRLGIKRRLKWFSDSGQKATVMSKINQNIPSLIESNETNDKTYYNLNNTIPPESIVL